MSELPKELHVVRAAIMDGDRVLLMQRAKNDTYRPGAWELPGGKVDPGEDDETALLREVGEETGLSLQEDLQLLLEAQTDIIEGKYAGRTHVGRFYAARRLGACCGCIVESVKTP